MKVASVSSSLRWRRVDVRMMSASGTVSAEEIEKFSKVGEQWWNPKSHMGTGPLHRMNPLRVEYIRRELAEKRGTTSLFPTQQIRGMRVLDVGCGGGLLAESLARLGATVVAIDPSRENVAIASRHSKHDPTTAKIHFEQCTVEEMASEGGNFDVVTSLEVLEHVEMPLEFLSQCSSCLKDGGSLFLSTLNRTTKSYLLTIGAAEHLLKVLPIGTHDWNKFIKPEELVRILASRDVNMTVTSINGMVINFSGVSTDVEWVTSPTDLDVNYILHAVKKTATR